MRISAGAAQRQRGGGHETANTADADWQRSACFCFCPPAAADFAFSPQDLYSLPQLPAEYTELNNCINQLLESGAEYAAPVSGSNIQPVQLEDLDGDGEEEALAFFRNSADEKPLKIYIFTAGEQTYEQTAVIEGTGTSIYSIAYEDLDQDGRTGAAGGLAGQYGPAGPVRLHPAVRGAGGAGAGHQLCEVCGQRI